MIMIWYGKKTADRQRQALAAAAVAVAVKQDCVQLIIGLDVVTTTT